MDASGNFTDLVQAMTQLELFQDKTDTLTPWGTPPQDRKKRPSRRKGKTPDSGGIAAVIRESLDAAKVIYGFDEETGLFAFYMRLRSCFRFVAVNIRVDDDGFMVTGEVPIPAPYKDEKLMREVTEMVCRINYAFRYGSFELDVNDGEFRFRRHVDCTDIAPTPGMVNKAMAAMSFAFYAYAKAIAEVFSGESTAKDAIRRVNKNLFPGKDGG